MGRSLPSRSGRRTGAPARATIWLAALLLASGCRGRQAEPAPERVVSVVVTIDWEGAYLDPASLEGMKKLRADHPGIPITHFVCPSYYTKPEADADLVTRTLESAVRDGDEVALHLHAWRSLVQAAGVEARMEPSFLSHEGGVIVFEDGDAGFEVELGAYEPGELRAIFGTARSLLEDAGFEVGLGFRAGGWLATPRVLEAARAEGFSVDSSAALAEFLVGEMAGRPLPARVREVWRDAPRDLQPYWIETRAGPVLEMPNSAGFVDYLPPIAMMARFRELAGSVRGDVFINIGVHHEAAEADLPRLHEVLTAMKREEVVFETLSSAAARARAALGKPDSDRVAEL